MCALGFFLSTFLFSLALGPHVMPLRAEDPESSTSMDGESTAPPPSLTEGTNTLSKEKTLVTTSGGLEDQESKLTTATLPAPETQPVEATTVTTAALQATSAPMQATSRPETTIETTASPVDPTTESDTGHKTTTMATEVASMTPPTPELTTTPVQQQETTVITEVPTTLPETTQIPSTAASTPAPTTAEVTSTPTSPTVVPRLTTPSAAEITPSTMAETHLTTQHPSTGPVADTHPPVADLSTTDPKASSKTMSSTESTVIIKKESGSATGSKDEGPGGSKWLIFIIAVVTAIALTVICVIVIIKCRKKRGAQQFGLGNMNGQNQKSKKKKGADDTWAGPMPLEGGEKGECEGPEDGGQEDDKKPDGTDTVLSTFAATEENGGVGRPGSMEVQKWEEKEPLLYIDEDVKGDGKEGAEKAAEAGKNEEEEPTEQTELKGPKLNGGEAFCLTTAV